MSALVVIVGLLILAGLFSALHGVISPLANWLSPMPPRAEPEYQEPADDAILLRLDDGTPVTWGMQRQFERELAAIAERQQQARHAPRAKPNVAQRAGSQLRAKNAAKRRLRAAMAEHERRPKPPRNLP